MDNVTEKLLQCFGHRKFKSELQESAIRAIARGKAVYLVKVLCSIIIQVYKTPYTYFTS